MPKIKLRGLDFHYELQGQGETLILLGGIFQSASAWDLMTPYLSNRFQVLSYDTRDQGDTEVPVAEYSFADHMEDLKALLDGLGISNAHFVGISHGASIAMRFAATYPEYVNKLVLVSAMAQKTNYFLYLVERLHEVYQLDLATYFKHILFYSVSDSFIEKYYPNIELMAQAFAARYHSRKLSLERISRVSVNHFPFDDILIRIKAQTLLISGEMDRFTPLSQAKLIQGKIPGALLKTILDCGHTVNLEKPKELSDLILEFCKMG